MVLEVAIFHILQIMVNMNEQMDMTALHKVVMNFMKESEKLGVTEDMMNDTVEDAMGDIEDEEEEESVIHKVLDEIGVELSGQVRVLNNSLDSNIYCGTSYFINDQIYL